jgi:pyruvate dehydrogenase E1 component alpha subunit
MEWKERCPIERFRKYLLDKRYLTREVAEQIEREVNLSIQEAVDFAQKSPFPSLKTLEQDVYAN